MAAKSNEIQKLEGYIRYYLRRVIGEAYDLKDDAQPMIFLSKKPALICLPLSTGTLTKFLGVEFMAKASIEMLYAILVGLLMHEVAHDKSGEDHGMEPQLLANLICDANDINVVPSLWPGSIPFTLLLHRVTFEYGLDAADAKNLSDTKMKLQVLLSMAVSYMRRLRVKYEGKEERSLPVEEDPLFEVFEEKIKPIMREARRCPVGERHRLVGGLHAVLREWFTKEEARMSGKGQQGGASEIALQDALDNTGDPMSLGAGSLTGKSLKSLTDDAATRGVLEEAGKMMQEADQAEKESTGGDPAGGKGGILGSAPVIPYRLQEMDDSTCRPEAVDQSLAGAVRRAIEPILFERTLKRRAPSVVGSRFSPGRFYEIKTRPDEPRIRKDVLRIGRAIDEALVVLCFDRSGSMDGEKEKIARKVCATMFSALALIPRCSTVILGFNHVPILIKPAAPRMVPNILRRIRAGLAAEGDTNFCVAFREALAQALPARAQKRLVVMLTDGDLQGDSPPEETLSGAKKAGVEVVCIGVPGADLDALKAVFGKSAISVQDVKRLPDEIRKVVVGRTTG